MDPTPELPVISVEAKEAQEESSGFEGDTPPADATETAAGKHEHALEKDARNTADAAVTEDCNSTSTYSSAQTPIIESPSLPDDESKPIEKQYQFTTKEILLTLAGTALGLGSFKADDPFLVIPMLILSWASFVLLCVFHKGKVLLRIGCGLAISIVLLFVAWRIIPQSRNSPESREKEAKVGGSIGGSGTSKQDEGRSDSAGATLAQPPTHPSIASEPPKAHKAPTMGKSSSVPEIVNYGAGLMVVSNPTNSTIYALTVKVGITEPGNNGSDSRSFALNRELPPNQYISIPVDSLDFEKTTQPYAADWNNDWLATAAIFPGCVNLIFFSPSSSQLKQIVDYYASFHMSLPLGDANGTLTYRGGSPPVTKDVVFPLKAVLVKMKSCSARH